MANDMIPAIDDAQKRTIVNLLTNGSSRRVAASVVGCPRSALERAIAEDAEFAANVNVAEQVIEIDALKCLRRAARQERHWRAAAWLLERRNHEDFGPRQATDLSREQLLQIVLIALTPFAARMSATEFDKVLDEINEFLDAIKIEPLLLKELRTVKLCPKPVVGAATSG